jgi:hypothetical protein
LLKIPHNKILKLFLRCLKIFILFLFEEYTSETEIYATIFRTSHKNVLQLVSYAAYNHSTLYAFHRRKRISEVCECFYKAHFPPHIKNSSLLLMIFLCFQGCRFIASSMMFQLYGKKIFFLFLQTFSFLLHINWK